MANKFFEEAEPVVETQPENQEIKLGDETYSQEELQRLVGLGKIGAEAEEKFKTKIDRVWPEYTKTRQQLSEYETKIKDYEERLKSVPVQTQTQPVQPTQLTPDQRAEAIRQLDDLLKESKFLDERTRYITREERAAEQLINDIGSVVSGAEADGKPVANTQELLDYMAETGIKNPQLAYEVMFRDELAKIQSDKLNSLRQPGMTTTSQSTAGSKLPPTTKVTRQNLHQLVQEALGGE